jgi:hypothetical protein
MIFLLRAMRARVLDVGDHLKVSGKSMSHCYGDQMKRDRTLVSYLLIVCMGGVLLYGSLTNGWDWGDDFAGYIMQAKSLTEAVPRSFIEANRFTIEQSSFPIGPIAYPWGFPMLLAPFYAVFGLDMIALKIVGALSYLFFLVLLWFGFRGAHPHSWFLCLVGLFALNPGFLAFSDEILSDLPFLLFSTLGVVLIGALVVERRLFISRLWDSVLIGVVIAAAFFIRTNGVLLLGALGFSQLVSYWSYWQRQSQENPQNKKAERCSISLRTLLPVGSVSAESLLVHLAPYAVFFALAVLWTIALPGGGEGHLSQLKNTSVTVVFKNLYYYLVLPHEFFNDVPHNHLLYAASVPLAVVGMIRRRRSDYHVIAYAAATFFFYAIWPSREGLRFLFPVLPFYISFVLSGLESFQGGKTATEKRLRSLLCHLPVVLIIFSFGLQSAYSVYDNISRNRESSDSFTATSGSLFSFISEHTEKASTIIFFKPRLMRMMTNRKAVMINRVEDLSRGDYLCLYMRHGRIDQVSATAIQELLRKGAARLVYKNSDFRAYRLGKMY